MDRPRRWPDEANFPAGINHCLAHAMSAQACDGSIDGETLGDAPEIDRNRSGISKPVATEVLDGGKITAFRMGEAF